MKKRFSLLVLLLGLSTASFSQNIDKGTFLVNGSFAMNYNSNSVKANNNVVDGFQFLNLNFTPSVGYFFTDGLVLGLGTQLNLRNVNDPNREEWLGWEGDLSLSPFGRYYVGETTFFAQLQGSYGTSFTEGALDVWGWSVGAGYAAFLNDNISIEPTVSYFRRSSSNNDITFRDHGVLFGVNFGLYLK
ncbi:MAG: hypothetical protein AAF740_05075 [Bacteroidota bacterium]